MEHKPIVPWQSLIGGVSFFVIALCFWLAYAAQRSTYLSFLEGNKTSGVVEQLVERTPLVRREGEPYPIGTDSPIPLHLELPAVGANVDLFEMGDNRARFILQNQLENLYPSIGWLAWAALALVASIMFIREAILDFRPRPIGVELFSRTLLRTRDRAFFVAFILGTFAGLVFYLLATEFENSWNYWFQVSILGPLAIFSAILTIWQFQVAFSLLVPSESDLFKVLKDDPTRLAWLYEIVAESRSRLAAPLSRTHYFHIWLDDGKFYQLQIPTALRDAWYQYLDQVHPTLMIGSELETEQKMRPWLAAVKEKGRALAGAPPSNKSKLSTNS